MILWRISNYVSLDGAGGLMTGGRWHTKGRPVVYCSMNPATALLENLVHNEIDAEDRPERFQALKVEASDGVSMERIEFDLLPVGWRENLLVTQAIGDAWLKAGRSLILEVPSVLVPETWNVLVNPRHEEIGQLELARVYQHVFRCEAAAVDCEKVLTCKRQI